MQQNSQPSNFKPKSSAKGLTIFVLAAIASVIFWRVLPFENDANKGLAILFFIGILWLTEAVHITITALMVPVLAVVTQIPGIDTKTALSSFADPIIYIFFGGFALATALHTQKLDLKIATRLIALSGGHMLPAILLMFAVTAFLSMWISNTATAALMMPLALSILSRLDRSKDRKIFVFVLLGIAYSASIGGLGTLVGSPPNAIAAKALNLDFAGWMKFGLPFMLLILPLMLLSLFLVLRPNFRDVKSAESLSEDIAWTPSRIGTVMVFIVTALAWIFSSKIKALGISSPDSIIAISAVIAIALLNLASWKDIANNTDWGVLLLFGGGIALSRLLQKSGASLVLGEGVAHTFLHTHPSIIILVVAAFIIILTEFTSNTASAALLVPVFASTAPTMGLPAEALVMVIGIGASCAFMLPVATPPNAIAFGTGIVKQRDMMRVGAVLNVLCILLVSALTYRFIV